MKSSRTCPKCISKKIGYIETVMGSIQTSGGWKLLLLLLSLMLHIPLSADAYDLEKHLGLYKVVETKCELTKGLYNPCPEIKFFELVKGVFSGIEPHEVALVIWKAGDDDPEAAYEAHPVRHHKNLVMEKGRVWLTGSKDTGHQEYVVLKDGKIIEYRFKLTTTNNAGEIFNRDFTYQLVPVLRSKVEKFDLSYPDAIPSLERDREAYLNSSDAIYKKAEVDENLFSNFFRSKKTSLKWHIIEGEDGRLEDILDGQVSAEDRIPVEHTSSCISTHQGMHTMNFCDAGLTSGVLRLKIYGGLPAFNSSLLVEIKKDGRYSCFFRAVYPVANPKPTWKIVSKKLQLRSLDFEKGKQIFGHLIVEFEEITELKNETITKKHRIEGYIKPVITP